MGFFKKSVPSELKRTALTIIARGNKISGEMTVTGKLHIDGHVEGCITSIENLSVGLSGEIKGRIEAKDVTVSGLIEGEIFCEHLHISAGGRVFAKIECVELTMDAKSQFVGERLPPKSSAQPKVVFNREPESLVRIKTPDFIDDLPDKITLSAVSENSDTLGSAEHHKTDKLPNTSLALHKVKASADKKPMPKNNAADPEKSRADKASIERRKATVGERRAAAVKTLNEAVSKEPPAAKLKDTVGTEVLNRAKTPDENTTKLELKF